MEGNTKRQNKRRQNNGRNFVRGGRHQEYNELSPDINVDYPNAGYQRGFHIQNNFQQYNPPQSQDYYPSNPNCQRINEWATLLENNVSFPPSGGNSHLFKVRPAHVNHPNHFPPRSPFPPQPNNYRRPPLLPSPNIDQINQRLPPPMHCNRNNSTADAQLQNEAPTNINNAFDQLRLLRANVNDILCNLNPGQIVLEYIKQINRRQEECFAKHSKNLYELNSKIETASNKAKDVLNSHLEIIKKQQKTFNYFISEHKSELNDLCYSQRMKVSDKCEEILQKVEEECRLFKKALPVYAYKKEIVSSVKQFQMTVILADGCYGISETLPHLLVSKEDNEKVVCCEPNASLAYQLYKRCEIYSHGEAIGYVITKEQKENENNSIVIYTEKSLFTLSIDVPKFSTWSYVIFHVSLKRSVEADFLLEALRSCLTERKDFRVILLLPSVMTASKFSEYFSTSATVNTITLPSLILPVEIVWKKSSAEDHIEDAMKTALAIHALKEPGNVVIFLPTLKDIKSVLTNLNVILNEFRCNDAECVILYPDPLHLSALDESLKKKRKFFLTTHWAEMFNFTSVSYVIDSGVWISTTYDLTSCSIVTKPSMISRLRAKARKNLAGEYTTGTCYRLYNKNDGLKMLEGDMPDLLCKNPCDTIVSLFTYRPQKAMSTEFVENLEPSVKDSAISELEKANAIIKGQLTQLGQRIIKLPYLPTYSKLIILGIAWGFGFEAIVLVAFFITKKIVFIYSEDMSKEDSERSEAMKLHFSSNNSDTLTNLNIYLTWMVNEFEKTWCDQRGIDFDVLTRVRNQVSKITVDVAKNLKEEVTGPKSKPKAGRETLQEILFDCFKNNLCVYTGHYKSGYRHLSSQVITFIHPSSVISGKRNLPKFVVFETIRMKPRNFMMSITAVPEEIVKQAITNNTVPFELEDLDKIQLQSVVIERVGTALIKKVLLGKKGQNLPEFEDRIKNEIRSNLIVVEPSEEKGSVTIFAVPNWLSEAESFVRSILEKEKMILSSEEESFELELKKGRISLPVEVTWRKGGIVVAVNRNIQSKRNSLCPCDLTEETERQSILCSICLTWPRRLCAGTASVEFSEEHFSLARRLAFKTVQIGNANVDVNLNKNVENQLCLSGLLPDVTISEIKTDLQHMFPGQGSVGFVHLNYQDPFHTTDDELTLIHEKLETSCQEILGLEHLELSVEKPKKGTKMMKATFVNMKISDDPEDCANILKNQLSIESGLGVIVKINAEPLYQSLLYCSTNVFYALEKRLAQTLEILHNELSEQQFMSLTSSGEKCFQYQPSHLKSNFETVELKLSANNVNILHVVIKKVNELLEGEVLKCSYHTGLHKLFTHGGHLWLQALEKSEDIHIIDEYKSKVLRLYGSKTNCLNAIERIQHFLQDVDSECVRKLDLRNGRSIFKSIIKKYDVKLTNFIQEFNLRSAEMIIRDSQIILHGRSENIERAIEALESLVAECSNQQQAVFSQEEDCTICMMPPVQLSIRLEHCGHLYCAGCIHGLIENSKFPIQCGADDCGKDILLEDLRKGLDYDDAQIKYLVSRSMAEHITQNPNIIYCPAPDCSMFYETDLVARGKWNCPLCLNDICVKCNVVYHHGYSCDMYQGSRSDPNYSYKVWLKDKTNLCKQCPVCHTAIEKNEGCNHMTCKSCGGHFCWICLKAFATGEGVYQHQVNCRPY